MTWRHPNPNMSSDGVWTEDPPCRPRVFRSRVTDNWTYHCPAHPVGHPQRGPWREAMRAALRHAGQRVRHARK